MSYVLYFTSLSDIESLLEAEKFGLLHRIKLSAAKRGKTRPTSVKRKISKSMAGTSNFAGKEHSSKGKQNISDGRGNYDPIKGKKWYVRKADSKTYRKNRNPSEVVYQHGREVRKGKGLPESFISFCDFIIEGRDADLYHGTTMNNAMKILRSGKIHASYNGQTSLTRDKSVASTFGNEGVHFKINQRTLSQTKKITPTDWHKGGSVRDERGSKSRDTTMGRSEAEESVKGDVHLKHVHTLVMHKDDYHAMAGPKTEHEKAHEKAAKEGRTEMLPGSASSHRTRMKKTKEFHSLLDKHGIKLELSDKR